MRIKLLLSSNHQNIAPTEIELEADHISMIDELIKRIGTIRNTVNI